MKKAKRRKNLAPSRQQDNINQTTLGKTRLLCYEEDHPIPLMLRVTDVFRLDRFNLAPGVAEFIFEKRTDRLLETQGHSIAALGRFGYEEKGRGIVVVPGVRFNAGGSYLEAFYLTADEVERLPCLRKPGDAAGCLSVIAEYEPDKEIAVCFVFGDEYQIKRSYDLNPVYLLACLKQLKPDFDKAASLTSLDDEKGDSLVFTRGFPDNWNSRFFPCSF